jgi:hypothetical protein
MQRSLWGSPSDHAAALLASIISCRSLCSSIDTKTRPDNLHVHVKILGLDVDALLIQVYAIDEKVHQRALQRRTNIVGSTMVTFRCLDGSVRMVLRRYSQSHAALGMILRRCHEMLICTGRQ